MVPVHHAYCMELSEASRYVFAHALDFIQTKLLRFEQRVQIPPFTKIDHDAEIIAHEKEVHDLEEMRRVWHFLERIDFFQDVVAPCVVLAHLSLQNVETGLAILPD